MGYYCITWLSTTGIDLSSLSKFTEGSMHTISSIMYRKEIKLITIYQKKP